MIDLTFNVPLVRIKQSLSLILEKALSADSTSARPATPRDSYARAQINKAFALFPAKQKKQYFKTSFSFFCFLFIPTLLDIHSSFMPAVSLYLPLLLPIPLPIISQLYLLY